MCFLMTQMVTTTISQEIWNLAKEKHIKWTDALTRGVLELTNTKLPAMRGESFESKEDFLNRTLKVRDALQDRVKELNKENQELTEKNVLLEKETGR